MGVIYLCIERLIEPWSRFGRCIGMLIVFIYIFENFEKILVIELMYGIEIGFAVYVS